MTSPLLNSLNPAQKKAASIAGGHGLIIAGAGSGKTKTLTTKIAWLLETKLAQPYEILALTFTNKAAKEMLHRINRIVDSEGMWMGTFHGTCHRLLRLHGDRVGLPQGFQVIDDVDKVAILKKIVSDPKKAKTVSSIFSLLKEHGITANEYKEEYSTEYRRYQNYLAANGLVDFGELLLKTIALLQHNPDIQKKYQERFKYILVDEFQDTSPAQYQIIELLHLQGYTSIFVVGDPDQSIYKFRGAEVKHIMAFPERFNIAPERQINLEENYRSTPQILHIANQIIANNKERFKKTLYTLLPDGELPKVFQAQDEADEARRVAQAIVAQVRNGVPYNEMAVLYRLNAQSRSFEEQFLQRGIPYRIVGGVRFFERMEIKDILAYLRGITNTKDNHAIERIINVPKRGLGTGFVAKMLEQTSPTFSLFDAVKAFSQEGKETKQKLAAAKFVRMLEQLQQSIGATRPDVAIREVLQATMLLNSYDDEEVQEREANLQQLIRAAEEFLTNTVQPDKSLSAFVTYCVLDSTEAGARKAPDDAVTLMTVHAAKGLEFNTVFVTGLENNLFPSSFSPENLEEERRLMYVAVTRAKKQLYLTWSKYRALWDSREGYTTPSRFLSEFSKNSAQWS